MSLKIPVGLLDTSGGGCGLASGLGGQLLAGRLAAGGLAGCLLGASHDTFLFIADSATATLRDCLGAQRLCDRDLLLTRDSCQFCGLLREVKGEQMALGAMSKLESQWSQQLKVNSSARHKKPASQPNLVDLPSSSANFQLSRTQQSCLDAAREERASERAVPSATAKSSVTISRVSRVVITSL